MFLAPRVFRILLFLVVSGAMISRPSDGQADPACTLLEREKWLWPNPSVDLLQYLEEHSESSRAPSSIRACWECGIWLVDFLDSGNSPLADSEGLSFQRARCYQALDLKAEALYAYRRHIEAHPGGETLPFSQHSILEILFQERNYDAVVSLARSLRPEDHDRLLPESCYLIGQSYYLLGQDGPAQEYLDWVPQGSDAYPLAVFTRTQVDYRQRRASRALARIDSLLGASPMSPMPSALEELFWLTRSRILFQLKRFPEAADGFRKVSHGSAFLPDALLGLAWSHEAMGEPSKAIAHFLAVEETPADPDTLSRAQMEAARVFSQAKDYADASELFHQVQVHLLLRISQYKKWGEDPEWLDLLADAVLETEPSGESEVPRGRLSDEQRELWQEALGLLARERASATPLGSLVEIRAALREIESSVQGLSKGNPADEGFFPSSMSSYFPPLDPPLPTLDTSVPAFLDICLQLLDTENRLAYSANLLRLFGPDEGRDFHLEGSRFYRPLLEDILFPREAGEGIQTVLRRMQSRVRHLPYAIEDRERVLQKILFTKRILQETGDALLTWAERIEKTSSILDNPTRLLLLKQWMAYARSLHELRAWRYRFPLLFLAEEPSAPDPLPVMDFPVESFQTRAGERIQAIRSMLALLVQREIQRIHRQRAGELRSLLADSQRLFAESLLFRQEGITRDLQSQTTDEEIP